MGRVVPSVKCMAALNRRASIVFYFEASPALVPQPPLCGGGC